MSNIDEKVEALNKRIDQEVKKANEAYMEADREGREEISEKQKELQGSIDSMLKELDTIKTAHEKMVANNGRPESGITKVLKANEEKVKALYAKKRDASATLEFKHEDFFTKDGIMTTGASLENRRVIPFERVINTPVFDPEERPLRDYLNTGPISSDSAEWPIEQVPDGAEYDFDNQAGPVDSDAADKKPQSEFEWDLETRTVRDIAHYLRLHKNLMGDLPLLESYLPNRLRDGLLREESRQILRGEDANQELVGLDQSGSNAPFDVSGFQAAVANNNKDVADANFIDILGYAKTQLRLNNYDGNLILINPADMYTFMFTVDEEGRYLMNSPNYAYVAQYVVQNNYVDEGEFFVMDRNRATTLYFRDNITVDFSYEDQDNFVKNLVTIRGEERAVLVTDRPNGNIYGDFAGAIDTE